MNKLQARKRNRSRDDAGRSKSSYKKHGLVEKVVVGQASAWRAKHKGSLAIVDMHAGDGIGAIRPQLDLFDANVSIPTAALAVAVAARFEGTAILCEKDAGKRDRLAALFPAAIILDDHRDAPRSVRSINYVIVISDPCGPAEQGIPYQREIALANRYADFVNVWNYQFHKRLGGVGMPDEMSNRQMRGWNTSKVRYLPLGDPQIWLRQLHRRYLARSIPLDQSSNFKPCVLVATNFMSRPLRCKPFEVFYADQAATAL